MRPCFVAFVACGALVFGCGRVGFDDLDARVEDGASDDALVRDGRIVDATTPPDTALPPRDCEVVPATLGRGGMPSEPGTYRASAATILMLGPDRLGCVYRFAVEGGGGGRGNHDSPASNADGGSGGRVVFEMLAREIGAFTVVIGGGGHGNIGARTLDDPEPGAGGGGSSQVAFTADSGATRLLAVAGGGGGGGWAEVGSNGGGGESGCATNADEGSTGGCGGRTGIPHLGGVPGGDCPSGAGLDPDPCGGPGGLGSGGGAGGYGVGEGFGADEMGHNGSGGGGGGYGGGSAGGYAGDPGLGGGGYLDATVSFVGGTTGGALNGASYDLLELDGGDGRVVIEVRAP